MGSLLHSQQHVREALPGFGALRVNYDVQYSDHSSFSQGSTCPNHLEGKAVENSRGKSGRSVQGENEPNTSGRVSTAELVDFVKERASRYSIKELASITGLSAKAGVNLRAGEAGASAQTISTWCRNDPQFRAEYFAWCGGYLETDPEMVAGISRVLNDYARRLHGGGG